MPVFAGPAARFRWAAAAFALVAAALSGCLAGAEVAEGSASMGPGEAASLPFHLDEQQAIRFTAESRNGAPFEVCIVPASAWEAWASGRTRGGIACHANVRQATRTVELAAGEWVVALRCKQAAGSCDVTARALAP